MTIDASAILHVTTAVTKQWTKQRKAEERGRRSRANRANMYSGRVNFTEVAARIIPDAYNHTSGDGKYPVKKRQLYYSGRDKFRELTGRPITADYFTQNILRRYLNTHPETANWKIVADARGHLIIPNAGRKVNVPLGVLETEDHLREAGRGVQDNVSLGLTTEWPSLEAGQRYQAVVFIEKEGFNELMEAARIAERYNVAIFSAKGQSTEAARLFVDRVTFTLPRSFQPTDVLPRRLQPHADAACWLVSTIVTRMAAKDIDSWACVRIECDTLIQIMGQQALEIVQVLEDASVIETAPRRGESTIGFRMHRNYCERWRRVPCQNARLAHRITRLWSQEP